jgi:hypothetical protein
MGPYGWSRPRVKGHTSWETYPLARISLRLETTGDATDARSHSPGEGRRWREAVPVSPPPSVSDILVTLRCLSRSRVGDHGEGHRSRNERAKQR